MERDGWRCQAAELVPSVRCGGPLDAHEVLSRGRGGSIYDAANIVSICRMHHRWVGEHPDAANALGLWHHSWGS